VVGVGKGGEAIIGVGKGLKRLKRTEKFSTISRQESGQCTYSAD